MASDDAPTDYERVETPDPDKVPRSEWGHEARRAEILQIVLRRGGPTRVNGARLAEVYDVHRSTIHRDLKRLGESVAYHLADDEKIALDVRAAFHKIYDAMLDEGDHSGAWKVVREYAEWLGEAGLVSRAPDRLEVEHTGRLETDSYELVVGGEDEADDDEATIVTAEDLAVDVPDPDRDPRDGG